MTTAAAAHAITIEPNPNRVRIRFAGVTVADTTAALTLREGSLPPAHYIPRAHADMALLGATTHSSHCPFKGKASYFSIAANGRTAQNAVWTYEHPLPAVAAIAGYLAFYPSRVDAIEEGPR